MKKLFIVILLLVPASGAAQHGFDLKNASKYFDVRISVAECDDMFCRGKARFEFYKKGANLPYQVIDHEDSLVQLGDKGKPLTNISLMYDAQSVVNVGDFSFDGMEDIALSDGAHGGYGARSYRVYLSSRQARKFVYNEEFTELGQSLGMFEVDAKRKRLKTWGKSGCCWHVTEEYSVVKNRPVKVFVEEEDATIADETRVRITTKRLIAGKWRTKVRYTKRQE